jgi:hypothetical protein
MAPPREDVSMKPMKQVMMAGLVAAALGVAPVATAQETGHRRHQQTPTQRDGLAANRPGSGPDDRHARPAPSRARRARQQQQGSGGPTRRPSGSTWRRAAVAGRADAAAGAGELQGEQREQIANFISRFNEFATATTDWREKYEAVDESLNQILDTADTGAPGAAAAPAPSSEASTGAEAGAAGETAAADGSFDPTIIAKLRETREHLDAFELATGDPSFVAERIEKILDNAASGSTSPAIVGRQHRGHHRVECHAAGFRRERDGDGDAVPVAAGRHPPAPRDAEAAVGRRNALGGSSPGRSGPVRALTQMFWVGN